AGVEGAARTSLSLGEALLRQLAARTHLPQSVALALLAVAAATAAVWLAGLLRPRAARAAILTRLRCLDAPVVYAVGILLATFVILRHIRSWYISGPLVVGALVLAILLEAGWGEIRGSRGTRPLSRLLVGTIVFAHAVLFPAYVNEIVMSARVPFVWREAAAWVDAHTVEGDRVASFNSGSFGYLSPRPVVNLDCVVNNPGMEALEQRRLLAFLEERGVRYLLDDPFYVNRYMNAYAGGDWKAAVVPVETLRERMRVYAVHPIAQTP
ncbi:MAG: hypothetical protein QUU85_12660, partial [Candidatus Eisenbacteria bacterium]|nr:hypothetical protein [Candidatus Eisenbacteria bacterium]